MRHECNDEALIFPIAKGCSPVRLSKIPLVDFLHSEFRAEQFVPQTLMCGEPSGVKDTVTEIKRCIISLTSQTVV